MASRVRCAATGIACALSVACTPPHPMSARAATAGACGDPQGPLVEDRDASADAEVVLAPAGATIAGVAVTGDPALAASIWPLLETQRGHAP